MTRSAHLLGAQDSATTMKKMFLISLFFSIEHAVHRVLELVRLSAQSLMPMVVWNHCMHCPPLINMCNVLYCASKSSSRTQWNVNAEWRESDHIIRRRRRHQNEKSLHWICKQHHVASCPSESERASVSHFLPSYFVDLSHAVTAAIVRDY